MIQVIDNYKVYVELREILKYTEKDVVKKIPQTVIEKINSVDSNGYEFEYDFNKKLNEQNIQTKTKELLSGLYLKYCCDELKKSELINKCKKNDEAYIKSTKIDFNKSKSMDTNASSNNNLNEQLTDLTVIQESVFSRIINKIKKFFRG